MGLGQPGDVADAALFVASKDATYITGSVFLVRACVVWPQLVSHL